MKTYSMPLQNVNSNKIPCACCNGTNFKKAFECEGFGYVSCKSCGLVQMNPQPVKSEILARYKNNYGIDYLKYELENEASFLKLQQLSLEDIKFNNFEKNLFSNKDNPPSILDIGCATGFLLSVMQNRGWKAAGVEISPCAEYARRERHLDVRDKPLEECNFAAESFDVIFASHLIEHLNDPRSFLTENRRILKKNGILLITTPNISGFQARLFGKHWRSAIFDHLYLFSLQTIKKMLKKTGFKITGYSTWGGLAAGASTLWLKRTADFLAKRCGCGDVMIVKAVIDKLKK